MNKLSTLIVFCLLIFSYSFTSKEDKELKWSTLSDIKIKLKEQNKPVLIDLYTDWCYWCKVMDKKTYTNQNVIKYLNDKFYIARMNAESKENVMWGDKTYTYNKDNKLNDFSLYVTRGQVGFPTTVIFPESSTDPIPVSGFLEPKQLEPILKFFGEGAYKTQTYPEFQKTFKSSW